MAQLIMNWYNDGTEACAPVLPEGVELKFFPELSDAVQVWLDIVRHMGKEERPAAGVEFYEKTMISHSNYDERLCCFLTVGGVPAATITVICDYAQKEGYIHMVASKPEFRGRGLGHLLNEIAVYLLKKEGMQTAYLTTDDWRLAAIKTYLKAGLVPDLESEPDFKERWEKIRSALNM